MPGKKKYPKPAKIGEIPMVIIDGELWGLEVSLLSTEEQADLKHESDKEVKVDAAETNKAN